MLAVGFSATEYSHSSVVIEDVICMGSRNRRGGLPRLAAAMMRLIRTSLSRRALGPGVFLLTLVAISPARAQLPDVQALAAHLAEQIAKSGKKSVLVMDFQDANRGVPPVGAFLAEKLSESVGRGSSNFQVLDRTRLNSVLEDQKFSPADTSDAQKIVGKVGRLFRAETVVTRTVTTNADTVSLELLLWDAAEGKKIATETEKFPRTKDIDNLPFKTTALAPATVWRRKPSRPSRNGASIQRWIRTAIQSL